MADYYLRQTCLNGHVASNFVGATFGKLQPYCGKCGEKTIIECPSCNAPQRGNIKNSIGVGSKTPLAFYTNCGKPYPWTERQIEAATEMVREEDRLTEEQKSTLESAFPELLADTPKTALAATRFKRIVAQTGGAFKAAMYKFIVDCTSETAKKIVLGE